MTDNFERTFKDILSSARYADFKEKLAASRCPRCPLWAGRTKIVVDRGNPAAPILVVGEAPGKSEDLEGRAFIGRAGKIFDDVMAGQGLDTNRDMLIANVAKCRPPGNRPPTREEARTCLPYLQRQIELCKPKIIVLLGATALRHIQPGITNFSMKEKTGKFFTLPEYPGIRFLALYHPAALLYDSRLKEAMERHAKTLKAGLEGVL